MFGFRFHWTWSPSPFIAYRPLLVLFALPVLLLLILSSGWIFFESHPLLLASLTVPEWRSDLPLRPGQLLLLENAELSGPALDCEAQAPSELRLQARVPGTAASAPTLSLRLAHPCLSSPQILSESRPQTLLLRVHSQAPLELTVLKTYHGSRWRVLRELLTAANAILLLMLVAASAFLCFALGYLQVSYRGRDLLEDFA